MAADTQEEALESRAEGICQPAEMQPQNTPLRVAVRVRPLLSRDGPRSDELSIDESSFDRVFGANSSQTAVTQHCATPLVDKLFEGMHGCLS